MASLTVEQFKKRLVGTDLVSNFFGELEALQFPEDVIREHYPEALERWQLLGATQSTPWMWVMLAELCLASFLAPTAVLKPIDSISVYAVLWLFFVHPGSTSTSNLLRVYGDALDVIEARARADRKERRLNWKRQHGKGQGKPAQAASNPYAGELSMTMSAGSLEGEGRTMSCPQNLGRSVGFLAEGKRFLRWLQAEGTMNEAIATELYERSKWKRTTIVEARGWLLTCVLFQSSGACLFCPFLAVSSSSRALARTVPSRSPTPILLRAVLCTCRTWPVFSWRAIRSACADA